MNCGKNEKDIYTLSYRSNERYGRSRKKSNKYSDTY